ncbi:MAG TPA: peptidylprolyl isomerase [Bacteroidia bacterium]|mgnify:CR=1 FL=1|nr:peptidylprolyl isomerase [Bacteroidia bacterium]
MKKIISGIAFMLALTVAAQAQQKKSAESERIVEISTDFGKMKIKLYNETPKHRDNFIKLASEGFYDGLLFHRVISGFMIQGGDPTSKTAGPDAMLGAGDVGYKVPAEINSNLIHKKGTLCAARDGNPEKASSGCQFYVVQGKTLTDQELDGLDRNRPVKYTPEQRAIYKTIGGTAMLDNNYTVYGEVIEGMDVIDKIAAVKTKPGDRPVTDVKMTVKVIK